ncbi:signal peptide peptidase SppA [Albibacterium bauzanense]|uniref:Protease-4 n=1 Tax=Albibacterium bauzanense TaxID=653929 RepID=A0A4R1M2I5_9SPHI|nr:signal peptide peptidase SppA [Albibacterium bauzanense]TCK85627.1 protease-4 [Albibacterium bauzanense]
MNSFFKYVLATIVGIIVAFFLIIFISLGIIGGLVHSINSDESVIVADNSVLTISIPYTIDERTNKGILNSISFAGLDNDRIGLNDILTRIKVAKTDDKIKGIYLDLSSVTSSFATLEEIRNALEDFKTSKKFVIAYSEYYSQSSYYLASTADKIYLYPEGLLEFTGLSSQSIFFKGALDKLGIEAQVIKVGTYKSAVEPYILDKMSAANKEQVTSFLGSIYSHYLDKISLSRKIPADSLFNIADKFKVQDAKDAVTYGLVDATKYKDEILAELKSRLKIEKDAKINSISIEDYNVTDQSLPKNSKDRIAVVYAVGEIVSGEGNDQQIGSEKISRAIRTVREDEKVKAVVLRVNSPGGSALASDVIWREVVLTKAVKPIVVSMGDLAASGGYYISAAADSIFAQPNTITGSIGVFGIIPNFQRFFNDKLGITFDVVKTAEFADLGAFNRPLTAQEESIIQQNVNKIYYTFTQNVADGRKKERSYIDSIGQGRVWTGTQAIELGLVDRIGGIEDAIKSAAKKANIQEYSLVNYPSQDDPLKALFNRSGRQISLWFTKQEMGLAFPVYQQVKETMQQSGIQARIPYTIDIK